MFSARLAPRLTSEISVSERVDEFNRDRIFNFFEEFIEGFMIFELNIDDAEHSHLMSSFDMSGTFSVFDWGC